jgi:hypothetical protein
MLPVGSKIAVPGSFRSAGGNLLISMIDLRTGTQEFFGDEPPSGLPFDSFRIRRALAVRAAGGIWSGHILAYTIDAYSSSGELIEVIRRNASWFEDYETRPLPIPGWSPQQRPVSHLRDVQEEANRRIWALSSVPRAQWARGLGPPIMRQPRRPVYPIADDTLFREAHIELLDPANLAVVASKVVPGRELIFIGPAIVAGIVRDSDDVEELRV